MVSLADGIASMYLKLISVDSNMCAEVNGIGLTFCSMSTRALQRMRNEVFRLLVILCLGFNTA